MVPQKIKKLSILLGLSQAELARRIGMLPSHLNVYLQGKGDIHSSRLLVILNEMGIDIEEILDKKIAAKAKGAVSGPDLDSSVTEVMAKLRRMPKAEIQAISLIVGKISADQKRTKGRRPEWNA